jgi:uncharacterized protein (DUF433 family)
MPQEPAGDDLNERLLALPRDAAAKLAGLSERQVDYWDRTGLVSPTMERRINASRHVRLYGFVDLLSLVVAAELKQRRGVSLQQIRQIVVHLKSRGYEQPLTQLKFATVGNRVYFQHDDGSWEGGLTRDQLVFHQVLDLSLVRQRIVDGTRRDERLAGQVERRRGALGNKPVFAGTRVPVDTVRRYLLAGRSVDDVLEAFPDLTIADIATVQQETVA